jgi:hypothetical protein
MSKRKTKPTRKPSKSSKASRKLSGAELEHVTGGLTAYIPSSGTILRTIRSTPANFALPTPYLTVF